MMFWYPEMLPGWEETAPYKVNHYLETGKGSGHGLSYANQPIQNL